MKPESTNNIFEIGILCIETPAIFLKIRNLSRHSCIENKG